jgi:hypothetical protein
MISSLNNQGKVQFMIYSENINSQRLILVLKQVIKKAQKKYF